MIDMKERRAELRAAYDTLVAFNLWRRGRIEAKEAADTQEIGDALDTACGVLWELTVGDIVSRFMDLAEALDSERKLSASLRLILDDNGVIYALDKDKGEYVEAKEDADADHSL